MQENKTFNINGKKQYIMFDLNAQNNNIWYWDNVISSPNELVGFIEELDNNPESYPYITKWKNWTASNDDSVSYGETKQIMKNLLTRSIDKKLYQKSLYIINSLNMALDMCFDRYAKAHQIDQSKYRIDNDVLSIKKWIPGSGMGPHADGQDGDYNLGFTVVMYLNDDYEGGEISFPNHNVKIKPKAGSLIMFPATKEFIHQVEPIISGTRYTSTASILVV